jgi:hypothetical protein
VPNATRDNVVPINVVPVNHAGRFAKNVISCADKFPNLLSNSSCSLLAALKLVSSTEKKIEKISETMIPKSSRTVMLFLLPEVEHKVENERQHYSPVGFPKPDYHGLVDSDDQKSNSKRKDKNVGEFHV